MVITQIRLRLIVARVNCVEEGYMGSANDWRDIEVTGFVKLKRITENDNFV